MKEGIRDKPALGMMRETRSYGHTGRFFAPMLRMSHVGVMGIGMICLLWAFSLFER